MIMFNLKKGGRKCNTWFQIIANKSLLLCDLFRTSGVLHVQLKYRWIQRQKTQKVERWLVSSLIHSFSDIAELLNYKWFKATNVITFIYYETFSIHLSVHVSLNVSMFVYTTLYAGNKVIIINIVIPPPQ